MGIYANEMAEEQSVIEKCQDMKMLGLMIGTDDKIKLRLYER
jgi:hypothetical protein